MATAPRIGVLMDPRYLGRLQPAGVSAELAARGYRVELIDPARASELGNDDWLDGIQLIVARGRSLSLLSLLAWAESLGITAINRPATIAAVHNPARLTCALAARNIPTPPSSVTRVERLASMLAASRQPLALSRAGGDDGPPSPLGRGFGQSRTPEWAGRNELTEPFLSPQQEKVKIFGIGDRVWAVRRRLHRKLASAGARVAATSAELVHLSPPLRDLAERCRGLFGLELYVVECLETSTGPLVTRIVEFPDYVGVPDADAKLADYVVWRMRQDHEA